MKYYIEGIEHPELLRELISLFETAPELSSQANPMFDNDTWEDVFSHVYIEDEGLGFVVEYDGTMRFVHKLLGEFLDLIAEDYRARVIDNY
jgi:hypothetical protein